MASLKTLSPALIRQAVDRVSVWAEEGVEPSSQEIHQVFSALFHYVQHVIQSKEFQEKEVRQGIRALLLLILEAADRLERTLGKGVVRSLKEVQDLQSLYQHKVQPLFSKEEEMKIPLATKVHEKHRIEGLNGVKEDRQYELLLTRKEDGASHVGPSLKAHLELLQTIYALLPEEENLLSKAHLAYDHVFYEMGKAILKEKRALIDSFYKEALKFKNQELIKCVNKALMALMLAANSRNLCSNVTGKSCQHYYRDFHLYLRQACSIAFKKKESKADLFLHTVLQLKAELAFALFLTPLSQGHISTWLLGKQEGGTLREHMAQLENVPLVKAAALLNAKTVGFDPLIQGYLPGQLYRFTLEDLDVSVLNLPSPTYQIAIQKADIVPEFSFWIEEMQQKGRIHLLVNLQDRILRQEHARAICLEKQTTQESLVVLSLDRHSPFYEQNGPYLEWDDPAEFFQLCQDQMFSESTGFYIPAPLLSLKSFVPKACSLIHEVFFAKKEKLTQKNRSDFIEILYLFFVFKAVEVLKADSISFTDKDGVDDAAIMNAELFALLQLWQGESSLSKEGYHHCLELLYAPSLYVRGRLPHLSCDERQQSAIKMMATAKNWKPFSSLFKPPCSPHCIEEAS